MFEGIMELKDISAKGTDGAEVKVRITFETTISPGKAYNMVDDILVYLKRTVKIQMADVQEPLPIDLGPITPARGKSESGGKETGPQTQALVLTGRSRRGKALKAAEENHG